MKIINYYQILEIDPFASQEEIKRAYLAKLKDYHPDKRNGNNTFAFKHFQAVMEAYEALKTPEKRKAYDALLKIEIYNQSQTREQPLQAKNDNKTNHRGTGFLDWFLKRGSKEAETK